jgi:phosphomannomutase|tara:strand:- start:791 stop:1474 length:684 start_codon:yes stop_codon:yes gene_type:complete
MVNYLFDVDGTLTPSRGVMDNEFKEWFLNFCRDSNVSLVTGSDKLKTVEQIGENVYNACARVYNCSGNDVYEQNTQIEFNDWTLPSEVEWFLTGKLNASPYRVKTGLHIEHRTGMINFSIVGRNANTEQRKDYYQWDRIVNERKHIASEFNSTFPDLEADIGGETGIDIFERGRNKSQVLKDFKLSTLKFYGDRTDPAGNDYSIASKLNPNQVYTVTDWKHCWELLK